MYKRTPKVQLPGARMKSKDFRLNLYLYFLLEVQYCRVAVRYVSKGPPSVANVAAGMLLPTMIFNGRAFPLNEPPKMCAYCKPESW